MGKSGFMGLDAFGKTLEESRIRTNFGGYLTIICAILISLLTFNEFRDYTSVELKPRIQVDQSRSDKLQINFNITFPRVPCYLLSMDVMDVSGEQVRDLRHAIIRTRLDEQGEAIDGMKTAGLSGYLNDKAKPRECGSCYGGVAPNPEGCCYTCDQVRESYVKQGWSFVNPDGVKQCVDEHWAERVKEQSNEGCNVAGLVDVNKVVGNFHISPGRSFQSNAHHIHDLVPYLKNTNTHHDFGHIMHHLSFKSTNEPENSDELKALLGINDPLSNTKAHTEVSNYMFQYFVKVVSTDFDLLNGGKFNSHQYSATSHERNLDEKGIYAQDTHGQTILHGMEGFPGVFFNYDISPLRVIYTETHRSFASFLTSTCAIVGGVLTVASLIDAGVFGARQRLSGKVTSHGSADGKLL
ncbi:hypothetical protein E3P99_03160 [Wallemia hederae]|uniref:Endoplasmic reticulum vesicle transporter C-terminal domain-containing protein n=1 Tax=Wallemia hederae TaxID=1540922 RepID=A0A4T0FGG2_9BASI|nr:hypothetical protein E3P99_03160 [Wallemia hederae]